MVAQSAPYRQRVKQLVTTPDGMAQLDIAGSGRHAFVNVTVFGDDGWAVREEMWWSGHDEPLGAFVSRLTGLTTDEAQRAASDFLSTWEHGGGQQEGAPLARRFGLGVVSALLAAGVLGVLGTVAVRSILTSPQGRASGQVPPSAPAAPGSVSTVCGQLRRPRYGSPATAA